MPTPPPHARLVATCALGLALTACAAVPDRVAAPVLTDRAPIAGDAISDPASWPSADWWRQFDDPQLDVLIRLATDHAPGMALARSRFDAATAAARLTAAQLGLSVDGSAGVARQRMSDNGLIPSQFLGFNWYSQGDIGVGFSYDFDWWGRKRSALNAALGQARAAAAEQAAATLALQVAVADTWYGWQADQARLALAHEQLGILTRLDDIAALRVRQGVDLADSAREARARLASAREQVIALEGSAAVRRVALAALAGVVPDQLPPMSARPLPVPVAGVPAGASLDLLARRPDIAASRWQVEAALRRTDEARALFFPDLSLTAMAGLSSIDLGKLLDAGSRTFALGPALHLPLFSNGALQANHGVSRARLDAAVAQYESSVVDAAREVATQALVAAQLASRQGEQRQREALRHELLDAAQARARQGIRDARESLAAQLALVAERGAATELSAQSVATELALIKALGGGYRADSPLSSVATSRTLQP